MTTISAAQPIPIDATRWQVATGRVLAGFVALFLFVDGAARVAGFAPYVEGTVRYGFEAAQGPWLGVVLLASTLLFVVPRTALIGAVLVTGYLGGAVATHVNYGDPWFFPVAMGAVAWLGLLLKDGRARGLLFAALRGAPADRSGR